MNNFNEDNENNSNNGELGTNRIMSLFFKNNNKEKRIDLDDRDEKKHKSRVIYTHKVKEYKDLENQNNIVHPTIREDIQSQTPSNSYDKIKKDDPIINNTEVVKDSPTERSVEKEIVKEHEEVLTPPPPIKQPQPIIIEEEEKDILLEMAVVNELTMVIKEDLAKLEILEYQIKVLQENEEKEYDAVELERLKLQLVELIKEFETLKEKYDIKDNKNIELKRFIDDQDIYQMVRNYTDTVKENTVYEEIQKIEEYISIIDKIIQLENKNDTLEEEIDEKLDKFNIRDDEFNDMVNDFGDIDKINREVEVFTKRQDTLIYELEEKIKKTGEINTTVERYTEFVPNINNLINSAILFNASKKIPPTPAGNIIKTSMILQAVNLAVNFIEPREKTREVVKVKYTDYAKNINNAMDNISDTIYKIDNAFVDIERIRENFKTQCEEFKSYIPEYDDFIKTLDKTEEQLKVNKKIASDYSKSFEEVLTENNAKVKRLENLEVK